MAYKQKYQGAPALLKALKGDQHTLPEHLKQSILDAPEDKKKDTKTAATKKVKGIGPIKKAGVGTKSIKERIYEDGRKKRKANTTKRATMTKKMYKK